MATCKRFVAAGALVLLGSSIAAAQTPANEAELIRARQDISTMEGVLERAISSGAQMVIAQLRTVMADQWRLTSQPRVTGIRLVDFGVLFNVQVPALQPPLMWEMRQLVQDRQNQDLYLALQRLRSQGANLQGPDRVQWERVIREMEEQINAGNLRAGSGDSRRVGAASVVPAVPVGGQQSVDPRVVDDPQDAYTREVKAALVDAMLKNSQVLTIGPNEWLAVGARDAMPPNPLSPGDSLYLSTWVMRVKGSVLAAYRAGTITIEEARKQVEISEQ